MVFLVKTKLICFVLEMVFAVVMELVLTGSVFVILNIKEIGVK